MHRPILMAAIVVSIISACGGKNQKEETSSDSTAVVKKDTAASSPYFPVYDFLRGEIGYVDSLPIGILKYTISGNKKDSEYIKVPEFHQIADEFVTAELKEPGFHKNFRETSFADKTNNNATFYYTPTDTNTTFKRIDIITFKGDVYDEVKSIYIEKETVENNIPVLKKLYWKPKRNFQIITVNTTETKPTNQQVKVVWDNRE